MTEICFIRHGETDYNLQGLFQGQSDIPLNTRGMQQARECAEAIRAGEWDLVVSSPLMRAYETAQIVAEELGISDVHRFAEFIECGFGDAEGMPYAEVAEKYPDDNIPGRESANSLRERVITGFEKVVSQHEGRRIVLVAHACVLNSLLYNISNGALGTTGIPQIRNGYVATLRSQEQGWIVIDIPGATVAAAV